MRTYVALLRAVNLGGDSTLRMADLSELLSGLGYRYLRTVLQSGNAIFEAGGEPEETMAARIRNGLRARLGLQTEVMIRAAEEWRAMIGQNPFPEEAKLDPSHLLVAVLRDSPPPSCWKSLQSAVVGRERVQGMGREAYIYYRDGIGRSKLTAAVIEGHLQTVGTSRNWNTVLRIDAGCQSPA